MTEHHTPVIIGRVVQQPAARSAGSCWCAVPGAAIFTETRAQNRYVGTESTVHDDIEERAWRQLSSCATLTCFYVR
jgi:hypothetical protein